MNVSAFLRALQYSLPAMSMVSGIESMFRSQFCFGPAYCTFSLPLHMLMNGGHSVKFDGIVLVYSCFHEWKYLSITVIIMVVLKQTCLMLGPMCKIINGDFASLVLGYTGNNLWKVNTVNEKGFLWWMISWLLRSRTLAVVKRSKCLNRGQKAVLKRRCIPICTTPCTCSLDQRQMLVWFLH